MDRDAIAYSLSVVALFWYLIMWAVSLLGCIAAYVEQLHRNTRLKLLQSSPLSFTFTAFDTPHIG